MASSIFLEIAFNHPVDQTFIYSIPEKYRQQEVFQGMRVICNFNGKKMLGFIVGLERKKPSFEVKPFLELLDTAPIFTTEQMELARWIASFYHCSFGEALSLMIPKEKNAKPVPKSKMIPKQPLLPLVEEQAKAVGAVNQSISRRRFACYLLHGVTGSGKTEVYRHLAFNLAAQKKQTLILVPEISLTPQAISRFQEIFGNRVAVLHSRINPRIRLWYYRQILEGEIDIILGARSALFAPFHRLGLIVMDEEHENSYKADQTPRYHARQVAFHKAQKLKIPLLLGSATPSIETYYMAIQKKIIYLPLFGRHGKFPAPDIHLVDLKQEWESNRIRKGYGLFSELLIQKIEERMANKEQVLIFLNRRGYSSTLLCMDCGHVIYCPNCGIPYTFHQTEKVLLCHYCNHHTEAPNSCPSCHGKKINYKGFGTEKITENLQALFPENNIERMDLDSTKTRDSHNIILTKLKEKMIDILVGTQMITKGLHYPNITLCGVITGDASLSIPDFRSAERTFSLITQISGRAGRGDKKGEVVIQAFNPEHYSIQTAINEDYSSFSKLELEERKKYYLPPYARLAKLLIRGEKEELVQEKIFELFKVLNKQAGERVDFLGPSPAPITKLNKNYRWHLILRSSSHKYTQPLVQQARKMFLKESQCYLEIDIDPLSLM